MAIKKAMTAGVVAGAVALAIAGAKGAQATEPAEKEKCYGVAKAGQNDCGDANNVHSCMGHAATDGDGSEWIAVPKGLCERLVGGSLTPYENATIPEKDGPEEG